MDMVANIFQPASSIGQQFCFIINHTDLRHSTVGKKKQFNKFLKLPSTSDICPTLERNEIVGHSDVVGAAPTTSSFST